MALDHLYIGPMLLQQVDTAYPAVAGALAAGYLYDAGTGDFATDPGGSIYQFAALEPLTVADIPDSTGMRQRLADAVLAQFRNVGVLDEVTEVTVRWSDWSPPAAP